MKTRGFEKIAKYADVDFPMPERKTEFSAGYDFCLPEEVTLEPGKLQLVPTGVKAYMQPGEWLGMHIRSSMAVKKRLMLVNNVGIIDADYYNNPDNEGEIFFQVINLSPFPIKLKKGDIIGQGIIRHYLITNDDKASGFRTGGFGSTTK